MYDAYVALQDVDLGTWTMFAELLQRSPDVEFDYTFSDTRHVSAQEVEEPYYLAPCFKHRQESCGHLSRRDCRRRSLPASWPRPSDDLLADLIVVHCLPSVELWPVFLLTKGEASQRRLQNAAP